MSGAALLRTLAILLSVFALGPAHVGGEERALHQRILETLDRVRASEADEAQAARAALADMLEGGSATPEDLLVVALAATALDDGPLLARVAAHAEEAEATPASDLALGYALLGRAELQLRSGAAGSGVALAIEDARTKARQVLEEETGAASRGLSTWLAARAAYASGDLEGALAVLDAPAVDAWWDLRRARALWRYERGSRAPASTAGSLAPSARADLEAVLGAEAMRGARPAGTRELGVLRMHPDLDRQRDLVLAWTAHRLGRVDEAVALYEEAYRRSEGQGALAVRGIASLLTHEPERLDGRLAAWGGAAALEGLVSLRAGRGDLAGALAAARRRRRLDDSQSATGHALEAGILMRMDQPRAALPLLLSAVRVEPGNDVYAGRAEVAARSLMQTDFDRGLAAYESLLRLRPEDVYARNNLGFVLREHVSPYTRPAPGARQVLAEDAPPVVRERLRRCVEVYREAVALIPEEEDGRRDFAVDWDLAGVVNDCALMLHYFVDVAEPREAERLYLRALRMTEDGFKDTYSPNLQRLYATVLPHRELRWYEIAERCAEAILREARGPEGEIEFVADEDKRAAARQDRERLRARILQVLGLEAPPRPDAAEEESPGNDG